MTGRFFTSSPPLLITSSPVHVLFAGEKVRSDDVIPTPEVTEIELAPSFRMVTLKALVRMKLTSYRRKDQVHLLDMLEVGLIDESWLPRLPEELAKRLQHLFETPQG